jgi:ATP-binding cassette subfamily B protein
LGPSGAGKSSLIGLLLGWHQPSEGRVLVNGAPLDVDALRNSIAWVDPQLQLLEPVAAGESSLRIGCG